MKKKLSMILALSLLLSLFAIPINAEAAVTISKQKATLEVDAVLTLKVRGLKEGTEVKWSSSKKSVATVGVATGKVTAKAEGSATITATVGEKKYKCTVKVVDSNKATPTPAPSVNYSRTNPAPLKTTQKIVVKTYSDDYTASICIDETVRGEEAWKLIKEANMFNDEPKDGYEYIVAKITVNAVKIADDKALNVSSYDFDCFSSKNSEYDSASVVEPEPELNGKLYAGGNTTGYVVFQVKKDDAEPKIVYNLNYDGTGGIWFKLQ